MGNDSSDKIWHDGLGIVNIPLGGKDRRLRFRAAEICQLEDRRKMSIMSQLDGENLGVGWLRDAIAIGVAHEFRGSKGRQKERLTEGLISGWIDRIDEEGIEFDELLIAVARAVIGGMPGGAKIIKQMDEDGDDEDPHSEAA